MKTLIVTLACSLLLGACGGRGGDVVYRLEQNDPNRNNIIGVTNAYGKTQAYGSIGISAHTGN